MTEHDEHPVEFLAELALGVLSESEASPVRAHVAGCESCRAEYDEMARVARLLPLAAEEREPSPGIKAGVLERIGGQRQPRAGPSTHIIRPNWLWMGAAVAAGLLLLAIGGLGGWSIGRGDDSGLEAQVSRQQAVVDAAASGTLRVSRGEGAGGARATLLSAPGASDAYVSIANPPPLPSGKRYQAWYIEGDNAPIPGQLSETPSIWLSPEQGSIDQFGAVAFTVEDGDGADVPSQDPFMVIPVGPSARAR